MVGAVIVACLASWLCFLPVVSTLLLHKVNYNEVSKIDAPHGVPP